MKLVLLTLALILTTSPVATQPAPRVATALAPAELSELEEVRKKVWVDWFSGDTVALRRVLGPELIAMGPGEADWQSLDETLAASAQFKASGGRLVSVTFDSSTVHRLGDVVVMFSRYTVVTENAGQQSTLAGRATEVFVRSTGRWVHTSWHLDQI